jgi:hypothetical protein
MCTGLARQAPRSDQCGELKERPWKNERDTKCVVRPDAGCREGVRGLTRLVRVPSTAGWRQAVRS